MPSSVMFGSRPRICLTRAYSSAVRPCSAAISGVTRISVDAVAIGFAQPPSLYFLFEVVLKSDRPLLCEESTLLGFPNRFTLLQIARAPEKCAEMPEYRETTSRFVRSPTHIHFVRLNGDVAAIVNVRAPENLFLRRV